MSSISPGPNPSPMYVPPPAPSTGGVKIAILFGVVIALVAANVYLFIQINSMQADMKKTNEAMLAEISKVRDASALTSQSHRRNVDALKEQLEAARRQTTVAVGQAKADAIKKSEEL